MYRASNQQVCRWQVGNLDVCRSEEWACIDDGLSLSEKGVYLLKCEHGIPDDADVALRS